MQDKADLYKALNLRLTHEHMTGIIRARGYRGSRRQVCGYLARFRGNAATPAPAGRDVRRRPRSD
jgi:hypothetical protein